MNITVPNIPVFSGGVRQVSSQQKVPNNKKNKTPPATYRLMLLSVHWQYSNKGLNTSIRTHCDCVLEEMEKQCIDGNFVCGLFVSYRKYGKDFSNESCADFIIKKFDVLMHIAVFLHNARVVEIFGL